MAHDKYINFGRCCEGLEHLLPKVSIGKEQVKQLWFTRKEVLAILKNLQDQIEEHEGIIKEEGV